MKTDLGMHDMQDKTGMARWKLGLILRSMLTLARVALKRSKSFCLALAACLASFLPHEEAANLVKAPVAWG